MYFVLGLGCEKSESVVVCVVGVVALEIGGARERARVWMEMEKRGTKVEKRGEHNIFQGDSGHE